MSEGNEQTEAKGNEHTEGEGAPGAAPPQAAPIMAPPAVTETPPGAEPPGVNVPPAAAAPTPASTEASADSEEEVLPEVEEVVAPATAPASRTTSHHPPPPPRLRTVASTAAARSIQVSGEPRLARDLMARQLFTIGPNDPIEQLEQHMVNFHFRHLPVVEGSKVVGLIGHADLLHAQSSFLSTSARAENAILGRLPASRIMQREFVTARPDEPLSVVAERLWSTRAEAVLVTEESGALVGILTERDFVRLAHHFLHALDEPKILRAPDEPKSD